MITKKRGATLKDIRTRESFRTTCTVLIRLDRSNHRLVLFSMDDIARDLLRVWVVCVSLKKRTSDVFTSFSARGHWLPVINANQLIRTLIDSKERLPSQLSLVYSGLAVATLISSSEHGLGAAGRNRAGWLRDQAQAALEASLNSHVIDIYLARAALVRVLTAPMWTPSSHLSLSRCSRYTSLRPILCTRLTGRSRHWNPWTRSFAIWALRSWTATNLMFQLLPRTASLWHGCVRSTRLRGTVCVHHGRHACVLACRSRPTLQGSLTCGHPRKQKRKIAGGYVGAHLASWPGTRHAVSHSGRNQPCCLWQTHLM